MIFKDFALKELLSNGDFESGALTSWSTAGSIPVNVTSSSVHSGQYAALLGNPTYSCYGGVPIDSAILQQNVSIPRQGDATLYFWYRLLTEDTTHNNLAPNQLADTLDITIVDSSGRTATVLQVGGPDNRQLNCGEWKEIGWNSYAYDLSEYAGQTVTIRFSVSNRIDGFFNTYVFIDDASLLWSPKR